MKEIVLIDADIVGYRIGFTTQNDPLEIAQIRTDELIKRIVYETDAKDYKCFLSGSENFRYSIYPEYKGNRADKPKPVHLEGIREYIVRSHMGRVVQGYEADDELGIELTLRGESAIVASIDKDLLQIPGWHYDFVKEITRFVTPLQGLRTFYAQLIAGDGADNIPSYDGKVRNQVPQFIARLQAPLWEMETEWEMYDYVCSVYFNDFGNPLAWEHIKKTIHRNAKLLYLWRRENDEWQEPQPLGQKLEEKPL